MAKHLLAGSRETSMAFINTVNFVTSVQITTYYAQPDAPAKLKSRAC